MDPSTHPRAEDRLALIEGIERDGRVHRTLDVHAWPVTLGRALDNTWVLDDVHVAAHHASLLLDGNGQPCLQAGPSLNGVHLGRRHLQAGQRVPLPPAGGVLQLGSQRLRVRLAGAPLAPEVLLARPLAGALALWVMALVWVLAQAGHRWVQLDPGADLVQWLPWLLGLPVGLALWCSLWALASKLFHHGFDFASHAAIALIGLLSFEVLNGVLPPLAAAMDWPLLWKAYHQWGMALLSFVVLRAHLRQVLPQRGRAINLSLATVLLAGAGVNAAVNLRQQGQVFSEPYMSTLPPPALRWGGVQSMPALEAALLPLRDALQQRAREAAADEPDSDAAGQ